MFAQDQRIDPHTMISPILSVQDEPAFLRRVVYVGGDERGRFGSLQAVDLIVTRYLGQPFDTVAAAEDSLLLPCEHGAETCPPGLPLARHVLRIIHRSDALIASECHLPGGNAVLLNTVTAEQLLTGPEAELNLISQKITDFGALVQSGQPVGRWRLLPIQLATGHRLYVADSFAADVLSVCYCGSVESDLPGMLFVTKHSYTMVADTKTGVRGNGRHRIVSRPI